MSQTSSTFYDFHGNKHIIEKEPNTPASPAPAVPDELEFSKLSIEEQEEHLFRLREHSGDAVEITDTFVDNFQSQSNASGVVTEDCSTADVNKTDAILESLIDRVMLYDCLEDEPELVPLPVRGSYFTNESTEVFKGTIEKSLDAQTGTSTINESEHPVVKQRPHSAAPKVMDSKAGKKGTSYRNPEWSFTHKDHPHTFNYNLKKSPLDRSNQEEIGSPERRRRLELLAELNKDSDISALEMQRRYFKKIGDIKPAMYTGSKQQRDNVKKFRGYNHLQASTELRIQSTPLWTGAEQPVIPRIKSLAEATENDLYLATKAADGGPGPKLYENFYQGVLQGLSDPTWLDNAVHQVHRAREEQAIEDKKAEDQAHTMSPAKTPAFPLPKPKSGSRRASSASASRLSTRSNTVGGLARLQHSTPRGANAYKASPFSAGESVMTPKMSEYSMDVLKTPTTSKGHLREKLKELQVENNIEKPLPPPVKQKPAISEREWKINLEKRHALEELQRKHRMVRKSKKTVDSSGLSEEEVEKRKRKHLRVRLLKEVQNRRREQRLFAIVTKIPDITVIEK